MLLNITVHQISDPTSQKQMLNVKRECQMSDSNLGLSKILCRHSMKTHFEVYKHQIH